MSHASTGQHGPDGVRDDGHAAGDVGAAPSGASGRFPCEKCGADLHFAPGTDSLRCGFCGHENRIEAAAGADAGPEGLEQDLRATLAGLTSQQETQDTLDVACHACGAVVHGLEHTAATKCPFCATSLVTTSQTNRLIKPHGVLPFAFDAKAASAKLLAWVKGLWFAPSDLKNFAVVDGRLSGVYIPAWTYDSHATSWYTGQRGDAYYVTVMRNVMVNGKMTMRPQQERRIRWSPASGVVQDRFDDVLVLGGASLPENLLAKLSPWDVAKAVAYDDAYLSGFSAETYRVGVDEGFAKAQQIMAGTIHMTVRASIGGDEQRVTSVRTQHDDLKFKHLLLPVWVAAYRYRGKSYRTLVNARTGEIIGDRPWSAGKIALAVVAGLVVIGLIVLVVAVARGR